MVLLFKQTFSTGYMGIACDLASNGETYFSCLPRILIKNASKHLLSLFSVSLSKKNQRPRDRNLTFRAAQFYFISPGGRLAAYI